MSINNVTNLLTVIIRSNQLVELPLELFECTKIRHLDISSNRIRSLYTNMNNLDYIKAGYIGIGKLVDLKEFYANDNELEAIPLTLQSCINLTSINVSKNHIKTLPSFLFQNICKRLKLINASENMISTINDDTNNNNNNNNNNDTNDTNTFSMSSVESLDLHKNQLTSNESIVFYNCPNLSYLNLSENKLVHCPCFIECSKFT